MPTAKTAPKATGKSHKATATVTPSPVALLGTGPGDPDLLTVRAADMLAAADVVLAAPGVPRPVLDGLSAEVLEAPSDELPDAAKEAAARAKAGQRVVRALPGDPF